MARDVDGKDDIAKVASISAQDPAVGELIAEAFDKVGKDGVITVEEANTMGLELEFTEGMQFDKGYISPYMVTDPERMEAVLEDAYILIHQGKISAVADLLPLLEKVVEAGKPLLDHRRGRRRRGAVDAGRQQDPRHCSRSVAVKAPGFGDRRKAMLEDIAILTGGQVVAAEVGLKLDQVGLEVLGTARRVVVTKDDTTIIDGGGERDAVEDRVRQIRAEIENTDSDWDREKLQERLAKLAGGVCVIGVGAATEVELKERKHRIEDAVSATRAAIEEGIVAGGGSALVHAVAVARRPRARAATRRPARTSCAGPPTSRCAGSPRTRGAEGYVVVNQGARARRRATAGTARPASTATWSPRASLDPVKVTRSALRNAASIASMVLTTDTLVVEKKDEEPTRARPLARWARPQPLATRLASSSTERHLAAIVGTSFRRPSRSRPHSGTRQAQSPGAREVCRPPSRGAEADGLDVGLGVAAVARRLGVAPGTLRTWARRYGIEPTGHEAGTQRRYNAADLSRLTLMRRLMLDGVSAADAAQAALDQPAAPRRGLPPWPRSRGGRPPVRRRGGGGQVVPLRDASPEARGLARAAMALDAHACTGLLRQPRAGAACSVTWNDMLIPVLAGVGDRWRAPVAASRSSTCSPSASRTPCAR